MAHSEVFTALHTVWSEVVRNHGCLSWGRSEIATRTIRTTLPNGWVVEVVATRAHGVALDVWPRPAPGRLVGAPWTWSSENADDDEWQMLLEIARHARASTARTAG